MYFARRRNPSTRRPREPRRQPLGGGPAQVAAPQLRAREPPPFQARAQAAHHGLDLGQFRHGAARYMVAA